MQIPPWLAYAVAAFVVIFGVYRIKLGLTLTEEQEAAAKQRGGLYGMGKRFHLFVGVIYIGLGVALTAMALGWQPLGSSNAPASPAKSDAPAKPGPAK